MWTQDTELAWDKLEEQRKGENPLGVFLGRAEAVAEVLTTERQVWAISNKAIVGCLVGHLSYWCDPEGEDGHDCSIQKTIMLKDGRYGQWKVRMKLLVRGINDDAWIAVKTEWDEPTILTVEGKNPKPKEPRQEVVREVVREVVQRMHQRGEVVTFWSKECISHGGEEHGDGRPDVDDEEVTDAGCISRYYIRHAKCVCQRVNQEACGVVETMWTQDAELAWDKLEEQIYTVKKRQEINLWIKFMP
ncbi:hypothetical protein F2Q70_00034420 [Brassica cretica]|uniref:Uncharacterized protein n=1 Tax=Brassica cretica TaxID=69181 RepID=A0A8S9JYV1_BRACR|nr:hypothetical protein F2Q68_00029303 [Brassica cretica]KAF2587172.1 hypothetical protein F2Q70_00034420 [Brassica cretica]